MLGAGRFQFQDPPYSTKRITEENGEVHAGEVRYTLEGQWISTEVRSVEDGRLPWGTPVQFMFCFQQ